MAISDTLIAEWLFNDATSGQTPSTVTNEVSANEDLAVTWDGGGWTSETGGNGIEIDPAYGHAGGATISSWASSNIFTAMGGATSTVGTIILAVRDIAGVSSGSRIFSISKTGGNGQLAITLNNNGELRSRVNWDNTSAYEYSDWGNDHLSGSGIEVIALTYDHTRTMKEKTQIWTGTTAGVTKGDSPTATSNGDFYAVDLGESSATPWFLNRDGLSAGAGGHILYAAIFSNELSDADVETVLDAVALDNDTSQPWVESSGVTVTAETGTLGLNSTEPVVSTVAAPGTVTAQTATLGLNSTEPAVAAYELATIEVLLVAGPVTSAETGSFGLNSTEPGVFGEDIVHELTNPTQDETGDGASLTIDSDSDLGTLYSYSKTTPFTGTDEENAAEIMANGVGQAPSTTPNGTDPETYTNTRVVTGQDGMTDYYAGWVQDSDEYGGDMVMEFDVSSKSLTIPIGAGTYDAVVDWGDDETSTVTGVDPADPTHTYAAEAADTAVVRISTPAGGAFPHLQFNNGGDVANITEIMQIGNVGWTSGNGAFYGAANATSVAIAINDASGLVDYSSMLRGLSSAGAMSLKVYDWDMTSATTLTSFLEGSQLSMATYDATLASWGNQTLAAGAASTTIHFGNSQYFDQDSKNLLLAQVAGIIDGGQVNGEYHGSFLTNTGPFTFVRNSVQTGEAIT